MNDSRAVFKELFREQLIGPGSDYVFERNEYETISDYPLNRYSSGIIFPKMEASRLLETISDTDEDEYYQDEINFDKGFDSDTGDAEPPVFQVDAEENASDDFTRQELYPNSMGLSFCLGSEAEHFEIIISFGVYIQHNPTEMLNPSVRIKMSETEYELIKPLNAGNNNYLGSILVFDAETQSVSLKRLLMGTRKHPKSGDFEDFQIIRSNVYEQMNSHKGEAKERYIVLSDLLTRISSLYKNSWTRSPFSIQQKIDIKELDNSNGVLSIAHCIEGKNFNCKIHVMQIERKDTCRVIKVLLENTNELRFSEESSRRRPLLNTFSMFQSKLQVCSDFLKEMPKPRISSYSSLDDKIADCQYRDSKIYAQSHNCAWDWDKRDIPKSVCTDFLPSVLPPVSENYLSERYKPALNIFGNSLYSAKSDKDILHDLSVFIEHYEEWALEQQKISTSLSERYDDAVQEIVSGQKSVLSRLLKLSPKCWCKFQLIVSQVS